MATSILTISRNEPLQTMRTLVLEQAGYHVLTALNDKDALGHMEAPNSFSLVLLCHSVPEASRVFLVKEIQSAKSKAADSDAVQRLRIYKCESGRLYPQPRFGRKPRRDDRFPHETRRSTKKVSLVRKTLSTEVLEDLKNSLQDVDSVRMTLPDDPVLRDLKRDLRKMIKRAEDAA